MSDTKSSTHVVAWLLKAAAVPGGHPNGPVGRRLFLTHPLVNSSMKLWAFAACIIIMAIAVAAASTCQEGRGVAGAG